jgi:prepilin-type N-terminal cleavage/methylation domain-containing protein
MTRARWQLRLADDEGFGLIELLIAMTILAVAIGGLLAVFGSSIAILQHANNEGTALTLADRQLESYRSMPYSCIPDPATFGSTSAPPGCGSYPGFPRAYPTGACSPPASGCATQTTTSSESPDHRLYTVTTAVSNVPSGVSGNTKRVTVTVTLSSGGPTLAQETSYFSANSTSN